MLTNEPKKLSPGASPPRPGEPRQPAPQLAAPAPGDSGFRSARKRSRYSCPRAQARQLRHREADQRGGQLGGLCGWRPPALGHRCVGDLHSEPLLPQIVEQTWCAGRSGTAAAARLPAQRHPDEHPGDEARASAARRPLGWNRSGKPTLMSATARSVAVPTAGARARRPGRARIPGASSAAGNATAVARVTRRRIRTGMRPSALPMEMVKMPM